MTEYMEAVSDPTQNDFAFDYPAEKLIFEKTFKILNHTLGSLVFAGTNSQGSLVSRFLSYHYEAFSLGLQPYLDRIDPNDNEIIRKLKEAFLEVKRDSEFRRNTTGGGKNYPRPLQYRIEFVERKVGEVFES